MYMKETRNVKSICSTLGCTNQVNLNYSSYCESCNKYASANKSDMIQVAILDSLRDIRMERYGL